MKYHNPIFENIKTEKKERILSTALKEFAQKGYNQANINHIADKANVSVGSLYKYFDTKQNLYLYIIHENVEIIKGILDNILNNHLSLIESIRQIIRAIIKHTKHNEDRTKLYSMMTNEHNDLIWKINAEMEGATANLYASLIEDAMRDGLIKSQVNPRFAAFFLDNLFITLQFSFANDYYKERMKLYTHENIFSDDQNLEESLVLFIKQAFMIN